MYKVTLILISIFMSACATSNTFRVEVDAIADNSFYGQTYVLLSGNKDVHENGLRFREFANIVSNAMGAKAMRRVDKVGDADMVVTLTFGISSPNTETYQRQIPVYGQNNTTTVVKNSYGQTIGTLQSAQSNPYVPSSYETVTDVVTSYNTFIVLTSYRKSDFQNVEKNEFQMVWQTSIKSKIYKNDLRLMFPYMALAALPYISENLTAVKVVELPLNDQVEYSVSLLRDNASTAGKRSTATEDSE